MKKSSYMTRALRARDPRYAQILGKLGYERADMIPAQITIPHDWEGMHWASQEKLALSILRVDRPLKPKDGQTRAQVAKEVIATELTKRAAEA